MFGTAFHMKVSARLTGWSRPLHAANKTFHCAAERERQPNTRARTRRDRVCQAEDADLQLSQGRRHLQQLRQVLCFHSTVGDGLIPLPREIARQKKKKNRSKSKRAASEQRTVLYSKQTGKMPDWDNLIVRCIANDLINKRMMGNQHGLGEEPPVWQPSGYGGGLGGGGNRLVCEHRGLHEAKAWSTSRWRQGSVFHWPTWAQLGYLSS